MMKQTVLPFKLETKRDLITSHGGLVLNKLLDRDLPVLGSGVGYLSSEHVFPLILMPDGGGRSSTGSKDLRTC